MKNIHFVTSGISETSGGPTWVVVNLAKQFSKRDFKVRISSFGNLESNRIELHALESELGSLNVRLDCYYASFLNNYGFVNPILFLKIILSGAKKEKIILNYVYSVPIIYFAIFGRSRSEIYLLPHGSLSRNEFKKLPFFKSLFVFSLFLTNFHKRFHFVFATRLERDNSVLKNSRKQSIIGFGIDQDSREFLTPPTKNRLLFLGRIAEIKNLEGLLLALNLLASQGVDVFLEIIGDGDESYVATIRNLVTELNLNRSVTFTGWRSGIAKEQALNRSSVLVLPSHSENFGVVVLEAAAKGIPSVLSPAVGISENVAHSNAGVVALSDSPKDLCNAIIQILDNFDEYAENAYLWSKRNSWDSIVHDWERLF